MEFNDKLKELRINANLTQDELAKQLFVSRTAISKWESGRGYPNIESLKAISEYFSVTIDELLSGDELLFLSEDDNKRKENHFRDIVFGILDLGTSMLIFLPFFGQNTGDIVQSVSLISLAYISHYMKTSYYLIVIGIIVTGVLTLALQNCEKALWVCNKGKLSLLLNTVGIFLFIIGRQPYAASYLLIFLVIKALLMLKKR